MSIRTWSAFAALVLATGCGSSGDGGGGGSTTTTPPKTATYSGVVSDLQIGKLTPIEGVKLCSPDHPSVACTTSDAAGAFTLKLPANEKLTGIGTKSGYYDAITFVLTTEQDNTSFNGSIISEATGATAYTAAGFGAPDPTKGTISVNVLGADGKGLAGATVELSKGAGQGPVYTAATGGFDKTAKATVNGGAVFAAVAPGDVTLKVTAAGKTCAPDVYGWPSTTGTTDGTTAAHTVSFFAIRCQ